MKKQINPNIKAHLIRSSFYVLLLLAVCVIPFALAQRNTTKRSMNKPKMAAKHAATAATSQLRNDAPATKGKAKPSTQFSNAFGTHPAVSGPNGVLACWYDFSVGTDTFVPGVDDIGNHTDDGGTFINLPFPVNLYGQSYTGATAGSNGHLTFGTPQNGFGITCVPFGIAGATDALAPYWTDQCTGACADVTCATCGIFTTTTGSAPDRVFYIEWRTEYFNQPGTTLNYEIALYENGNPPFRYIYNTITPAGVPNDSELVVGQKHDETCFTEFGCDVTGGTLPPVSSGQALTAVAAPTPTPTPTPACSPTVINGAIDLSDPTQTDRLFRDGIPSTCAVPKTCPGAFGDPTPHHYDAYEFTNTSGSTQCVTVDIDTACQDTNFIFATVYLGSFNPLDLCENYLADEGSSPLPTAPFSFNVDDGQTIVIVVAEVTADGGCPGYTMTVTNLCGGGGGPCTLGPWNLGANYPLISESVSVSTDGIFGYAAGGFDGTIFVPTDQFNQYDPVADTWTPLTNLPVAVYDAPSVYAANTNSIYLFGGIDINGIPRDIVQIYDITNGTWTSGTPMPDPTGRYFASAAYDATSGKIYVIGGFDGATFSEQTNNWIYDTLTDTWDSSTATPIPVAMGGAGYSIVGQFIYLAGHWNGGLASTDHYRYDIVGNAWTAMASVPVPIYRPASGAIGTNTYLVGGGDPFVAPGKARKAPKRPAPRHPSMEAPATSYSSTYVYDTLADTWSNGPSTNVAHSFTGGTAIGNDFIVVTGFDGGGDTNTVERAHCGAGGPTPTPTPTPTPGTPTPTPTPGGSCPPVITQSTSQDIVSGNSVACNDGFGHTDNSYWRAFNMNDFTGGQAYNVTSVDFGIELAQSGDGTGQPLTVNLYANHGAPFPGGDWQSNLIATSGSINIPDQSLTIFNQPITVTVPAGTLELVFEVFTPNGQAVGNLFFVGSNADPETGLSYLSAADCGAPVPTPTGDLGFPNMHIVFNVNGTCPGGTPTPSPTATATATPTATPSVTPSVTPTATPTATPGHSPTPRPRPTPHPRPTP
jgi:Kelch motif/Galactose oxidase, central domain